MEYLIKSQTKTQVIFFDEFPNEELELTCILDKYKNSKIIILTEEKIFTKYPKFTNILTDPDQLDVFIYYISDGDFFKNSEVMNKILSFMFEKGFDRSSCVIGFGGGKITDLAGYIASVFLRGVDNILIPTSLLSMVDASIGGKTGINDLKYGKNLIGTIYQPKFIIMNLWMLSELADDLISDGMSEMIKIFALFDSSSFYSLSKYSLKDLKTNKKYLNSIVKLAVQKKISIIEQDETDNGIRNVLNFGHTIGHAIESVEGLNLSHGKSVAIGMVIELEIALYLGFTKESTVREMKDILENLKLPIEIPKYLDPFLLIEKMKNDKKTSKKKLKFVVITNIGQLHENKFITLDFDTVKNFISRSVFIDRIDTSDKKLFESKTIKLKGSKSICNRALILAGLAKGEIFLHNFLFSEDTIVMIKCLRNLGIKIDNINEQTLRVEGNQGKFENISTILNVENAGTAARFLVGVCTICKNSEIIIDGNSRMRERPIEDLLDSITSTSIKIEYLDEINRMPFKIITKEVFSGGDIQIKSNKSSQFVSSLLLSSPLFTQDKTVIRLIDVEENKKPVSYQYIDMTIKMMRLWGIDIITEGNKYNQFTISRRTSTCDYVNPKETIIEPDASTANYYLSFVAIHGGEVIIEGIGRNSIQGDSTFANLLGKIYPDRFKIEQTDTYTKFTNCFNMNQDNLNQKESLPSISFDEDISMITDSFLALGVVCSQIPGNYIFRGLANQAIKESNRLELMAVNLNKIGVYCSILENGDGINIISTRNRVRKNNIHYIQINTDNDHRIAMAFGILGSYLKNTKLRIDNKICVCKTYPEFWKDFEYNYGLKTSTDYFDTSKSIFKLYKENYKNNMVFLIGMRSCGKSTFGKFAAEKLDLNFIDFDLLLLENNPEFKNIAEIVSLKGWTFFRELERNLFYDIFVNENYKYQGTIIACGGGIVENYEILQCLKSFDLVVFIDTHLSNIKYIIKSKDNNEKNRPSYGEDFDQVYYNRLSKYKYCSKFTFKTPLLSEEEISSEDFLSTTLNKLCEMFYSFIYTTCGPMKYPLPSDPSFFLSILFTEETADEILSNIKTKVSETYEAIEFRADHLINSYLDQKFSKEKILEKLNILITRLRFVFPSSNIPIIFTIRSIEEGGFFVKQGKNIYQLYNYIYNEMTNYGIEFFDLEFNYDNIAFIEEFYKNSKSNGNYRIILSKHFITENCLDTIKKDIYTMSLLSHDVAKIITNISNNSHYEEIKRFIHNYITKVLIHFQLGEGNAITRVQNTFLNPVYDDKISKASGKGQLTKSQVNEIRNLSGFDTNFNDRCYYVLGSNVNLSPSPFIYENAFAYYTKNSEGNYISKFDRRNIKDNQEFYKAISNNNKVSIASVTIPYKEVLFDYLSDFERITISEEAKFINSINTVKKYSYPSNIFCCNTDWIATYEIIIEILPQIKKDLNDVKILIIGAGGAAVATILPLIFINFNKRNIHIKNRTIKRTEKIIQKFNIGLYDDKSTYDIIISSIPKNADESFLMELIHNKNINEKTFCVDLAYTREKNEITNFRKITSIISPLFITGIEFLIRQGFYSFEVFSGKIAPRKYLKENYFNYINNK